jgi:hypothetical protein
MHGVRVRGKSPRLVVQGFERSRLEGTLWAQAYEGALPTVRRVLPTKQPTDNVAATVWRELAGKGPIRAGGAL